MYAIKTRIKNHYWPLILLTLVSTLLFYLFWNKLDLITFITDATGYISLMLIAITLIIGPVNILLKRNNPPSSYYRRDLGIYSGALAVIHSLTGLFVHFRGNGWQYFLIKTANGYTIRLDDFGLANYTGLIAALFVLLLLITSNDFSIRKLNPAMWKNIQRLSYVMFVMVIIHSVYYRIVANNLSRVYYLYLPLIGMVLIFQFFGIGLRKQNQKP